MDVHVVAATDVGHVRQRNEDVAVVGAALLTGPTATLDDRVTEPAVVAVLDGMGGHPAGDVASGLAGEAIAAARVPTDAAEIAALVDDLGARMVRHMQAHPDTVAMGTTMVAASLLDDAHALVFGVGDSTARWWQGESSTSLLPLDRGPWGGITQVLGGSTTTETLRPHVAMVAGPGRLLLCSDGLADVIGVAHIDDLLAHHDAATAVPRLVDAALAAGGPDNVTVVLVDLTAPAPRIAR